MRDNVRWRMPRMWFMLGGVCLLFAFLPFRAVAAFLLSAAAHECGHAAVMRVCNIPIGALRIERGGAVLRGDFSAVPYHLELLCAAAGPAVNVLLAILFWGHGTVSAVNVLLAFYNLLPMRGNDGAVLLLAAAEMCGRGDGMRRCLSVLGAMLEAVLLMLGAWVFWFGALADQSGLSVGYGALFFCVLMRMRLCKREYSKANGKAGVLIYFS